LSSKRSRYKKLCRRICSGFRIRAIRYLDDLGLNEPHADVLVITQSSYDFLIEFTGRLNAKDEIKKIEASYQYLSNKEDVKISRVVPVIHKSGKLHPLERDYVKTQKVNGLPILLMNCQQKLSDLILPRQQGSK